MRLQELKSVSTNESVALAVLGAAFFAWWMIKSFLKLFGLDSHSLKMRVMKAETDLLVAKTQLIQAQMAEDQLNELTAPLLEKAGIKFKLSDLLSSGDERIIKLANELDEAAIESMKIANQLLSKETWLEKQQRREKAGVAATVSKAAIAVAQVNERAAEQRKIINSILEELKPLVDSFAEDVHSAQVQAIRTANLDAEIKLAKAKKAASRGYY